MRHCAEANFFLHRERPQKVQQSPPIFFPTLFSRHIVQDCFRHCRAFAMTGLLFLRVTGLFLMLCCLLPACDDRTPVTVEQTDNATDPQPDKTLRFDVAAPFLSLNAADEDDSGATVIFPLLYSYLCVPDEKGVLQPDLAESWTYDPNAMAWTIHLRPDARFHDRQPVTTADVQYVLNTVLKNVRPSLYEMISGIILLSDHVLRVTLIRPVPAFMRQIWDLEIVPVPGKTVSEETDPPPGSGPFQFYSRLGKEQVTLTANPDYYNGPPALDRVIYFYQPDKEETWTRLLAGETDIAQELSPQNFQITSQYKDRFYFHQYTLEYYAILLYNSHDPLFADPRVRRALTHAIDRDDIVHTILQGRGEVAVGPMGVDSSFHNSGLPRFAYDPEKALELLGEAGWTRKGSGHCLEKEGTPFAFTLLVFRESQVEKKVARYIKLCLNEIGVRVSIQALAYADIVARYYQSSHFQAVLTEFPGACHYPEQMIKGWLPDDQGRTMAGNFQDDETTRWLTQALEASGPELRARYLRQAEARIWQLQPGTFLFHKTALDVMSRRFVLPDTFDLSYKGIYRLRQARLR